MTEKIYHEEINNLKSKNKKQDECYSIFVKSWFVYIKDFELLTADLLDQSKIRMDGLIIGDLIMMVYNLYNDD